jgi:hypothetical protein
MGITESENKTVVATRSFVTGLAPAETIYQSLKNHNNVSAMRFIIEQKGSGSETRYTLPGGKVQPGESWEGGTVREADEELGAKTYGLPHHTKIGEYEYTIPGKDMKRKALLTYVPIVRIPGYKVENANITDIKSITYQELISLINGKKLEGVAIEEHLLFKENIGENTSIKNKSLIKGIIWLGHIEKYLRKRFKAIWREGMTEQEFNQEYEKIKAEFMRRGLETGLGNELRERQEDKSNIELAVNDGFYGKDVLYFLPEIAKNGENWSGLKNATEGTRFFMEYLTGSLNDFLQSEGIDKNRFKLLLENQKTPIIQKTEWFNKLNNFFLEKIKGTFKINDSEVSQVYNYVREIFSEFSKEIKLADPNLIHGLYQDYALSNEINNANFGRLLSLFLGIDIKKNNAEADNLIRLEAGRHLLFLLKGMAGIKYFNAETEKIKNGYLQHAVEDFFGAISEQKLIQISGKDMRVNLRKSHNSEMKVIVDEKNSKTFFSFLRKGFEQKMEKIKDFYAVGIVFTDSNEDNIEAGKNLLNNFVAYIGSNYKGFGVETDEYKDHTEEYKEKKRPDIATGKRVGSMGDRLVRIKCIIRLGQEQMEMTIYPLFSLASDKYFAGWKEKIEDDPQYSVRRMLIGKNGIPGLYSLIYPPEVFFYHHQQKIRSDLYR